MITINYLAHSRPIEYWKITAYFLNKIKPENKKKIKVHILSTTNDDWSQYFDEEINYQITVFPFGGNYLHKAKVASQDSNSYSVKLDEDCFMSNHVWDFLIENINILDDPETLIFSPLVSTNIPLVDRFIEAYIEDDKIKNELYQMFLDREMPSNIWGVNYTSLNEYTINAKEWNSENFYEGVRKINHYYRGIHPVRISVESQLLINEYILNTSDRFFSKQNYSIKQFNEPYFTNNVFAFRTEEWRKVLSLPNDGFDEVPLSEYKNQYNKKCYYIDNGFCMHPMYNTVFGLNPQKTIGMHNGKAKEIEIVKTLADKICS